jgi:hypothetical protein
LGGRKYFFSQKPSLVEIEDSQLFSSPFQEQTFSIQSDEYFRLLTFKQTGPNSQGNNMICLSHIEFYGELERF